MIRSAEADATRGTSTDALVEAIDLAPTFLEFMGGQAKPHILEGRSLCHCCMGLDTDWRSFAVSEYDYSTRDARQDVGVDQSDARLTMIFDGRWKYTYVEKMHPMLFDLQNDPDELRDLGTDPDFADEVARLQALHFEWTRRHHNRITRTAEAVNKMAANKEPPGILIGFRDKEELEKEGRALPSHTIG